MPAPKKRPKAFSLKVKEPNDIEIWNDIALEYDQHVTHGDVLRLEILNPAMLQIIGDVSGKTVLDAGCGQGYFSAELTGRGAKTTGVDASEKLIAIARSRYPENGNLRFMTADLTKPLPFADNDFDMVVSNMVLMDFDPLNPALKEFRRILKRDGKLIFSLLHPFFSTSSLKKTSIEKIFFSPPHLEIKKYSRPHKIFWHIYGLPQKTAVYHRPLQFYFNALKENSFAIMELKEPVLPEERPTSNNFLALCKEVPPFLIIKSRRMRNDL